MMRWFALVASIAAGLGLGWLARAGLPASHTATVVFAFRPARKPLSALPGQTAGDFYERARAFVLQSSLIQGLNDDYDLSPVLRRFLPRPMLEWEVRDALQIIITNHLELSFTHADEGKAAKVRDRLSSLVSDEFQHFRQDSFGALPLLHEVMVDGFNQLNQHQDPREKLSLTDAVRLQSIRELMLKTERKLERAELDDELVKRDFGATLELLSVTSKPNHVSLWWTFGTGGLLGLVAGVAFWSWPALRTH